MIQKKERRKNLVRIQKGSLFSQQESEKSICLSI